MNVVFEMFSELISSSSSSSSSDDEFVTQNFLTSSVKKQKVSKFLDVVASYSDEEFREHFRLKRGTTLILIEKFSQSSHFKKNVGRGGKKEISAKCQIYIFLWFAGNKNSYREVANLFDVSISSVFRAMTNVLEFMFEISEEFIKFPRTSQEKLEKSSKFEQISGFPNVIGCVDGCYIYIRKPANKIRSTYINRHDLLSLTFQGICDADLRFIDVFVGSPSKIHDARIFELSFISKELPQICGSEFHILGDAAYPLRSYLLTPYRHVGNMTNKKIMYNKKLSQTRVKIENSFGLLKTRFRQLMRLDFHTVERMCKFILACCVLHNLCVDEEDDLNLQDLNNSNEEVVEIVELPPDFTTQQLGEIKRSNIADSF